MKAKTLDGVISYIEKNVEPLIRFINFNDGNYRTPNAYADWLEVKAQEHSYYQNWTTLDKRSAEYTKAKIEACKLLLKALWANSRLEDYDQHGSYLTGTGINLIYYNYEKMLRDVFPKQIKFLEAELEEKLKLEKIYGEKKK